MQIFVYMMHLEQCLPVFHFDVEDCGRKCMSSVFSIYHILLLAIFDSYNRKIVQNIYLYIHVNTIASDLN